MSRTGSVKRQHQSRRSDLVTREILLSFWKVHILHHAEEGPIYGQWIAEELRRHGYEISPGTLYPLLKRMETNGWLKSVTANTSSIAGVVSPPQPARERSAIAAQPARAREKRSIGADLTFWSSNKQALQTPSIVALLVRHHQGRSRWRDALWKRTSPA
jgi:hypothetical protein